MTQRSDKSKTDPMVRTSLSLPKSLKRRLEHAATDADCHMQEIVKDALEAHLATIERTRQS